MVEHSSRSRCSTGGHNTGSESYAQTAELTTEQVHAYLVVNDEGASTAEAPDGGHGVLHVGADQVDVVYLNGDGNKGHLCHRRHAGYLRERNSPSH